MPAPNQNLFAEFPPVTKAQWLAKIEKDLKGRPLSDLDWTDIPPLSIKPFFHADDFVERIGEQITRDCQAVTQIS